ncbi:MAG: J domain-containing protein [Symploca sp. SIO3C6]|uniref:J domain-containing protein n=1 Tax=Symploca sp. SIO1C4 TaxID=2607765 RepID=A0A6B3NAN3_9CYAN|nr:J domain-containing protein [Symploca sp. SIO3C6]NER27965.1 J domain-containing protein [Symploca sp. SIO1C4]NET07999.1 J domain-containing protein [Symploca sp. SIO2B6]
MNLLNCYRLLNLSSGASAAQIKASYRRLARHYHPDVNSGDKFAQEKFIQLTEAYKLLLKVIKQPGISQSSSSTEAVIAVDEPHNSEASPHSPSATKASHRQPPASFHSPLSALEQQLKWSSYQHLQQLLKECRFARAIVLVEGLRERLPQDLEVRQWQAIAYQRWGRHLVSKRQFGKAKIYLNKALKIDPHNRSLGAEVERDLGSLEKML